MNKHTPRLEKTLSLLLLASLPLIGACGAEPSTPSGTGGSGTGGAVGTVGSGGRGTSTGGSTVTPTTGGTTGTGTGGAAVAGTGGTGGAGTGGVVGTGTGGTGTGTGGAASGGAGGAGSAGRSGSGGATSATGGRSGNGGAAGAAAGRGGAATGGGAQGGSTGAGGAGPFTVTTPAFMNQAGCAANAAASCATFPRDNTNYGTNVSPAMTWTGAPAGTQSFAVVLQDLSNNNAHWVLWNIPATVTTLAENVPKASAMPATPSGSQQCSIANNPNPDGYFGPGACGNVYEFLVYALSVPTFSPTMATNHTMVRMQLQALGTSILGTASMRARSFAPNCP